MKTKDITAILEEKGIATKSQKPLEPAEFDVLFDALTKENQITNIEDYLDGITYIPSSKKSAKADSSEKTKDEAVGMADAPKTVDKDGTDEVKPETGAKSVSDKGVDNALKKEKLLQETDGKATEGEKAASVLSEKKESREQPEQTIERESRPSKEFGGKSAEKAETKPAREEKKPVSDMAGASKPQLNHKNQNEARGQNGAPRSDYSASSQGNGFYQKPNGNGYQPRQGGNPQRFDRPERTDRSDRFDRFEGKPAQQGQGGYSQRPQGADRFANPFGGQQQRGGQQRPQGQKNDRFGGQQFRDKDERVQNAPREKFKPQPIVRSQTVKGDEAPKQRGATRVVDMRAGTVDLSKYDERLDNFVPDSIGDIRGGSQKVKKQNSASNMNRMGNGTKNKFKGKKSTQPVTKAPTGVTLPEEILVSELASRLKVTSAEIVKRLMMLGMMVTVNQTVDFDTAAIVADEMGIAATKEVVVTIEEKLFDEEEDNEANLLPRAPVVCVMGHVDHGKTSILDAIRHTRVTTGEAGGITQHIGAYRVKVNSQDITFLDTPGHEAFTAMRARGAQATDIAILVVAADDGIMPQTIEAINHAKAAGIDIIVAINKMDKPTANPDNVKQELTKYDLVPEEWGGDVICVPVSALTGMGINDLLENVLLVAEVKELKANPNRRAKGIVIEAKLDKGRGPVATVLVQNGTLHNGDIVIAGTAVGHVRAMTDDKGRQVKEAKPSVPVEIIGLAEVPSSGDEFNAVEDERMARMLADQRREKAKEEVFKANARANLNDLFAQISEGIKELNVIVKADVGGSAEAVKQSLEKISNEEVKVRVIHAAAGGIREGDVMLAAASNAIIVGFNVRPDKGAIDSAERQNVEIRTYRVIYDCINEITDAMKGMLAPQYRENLLGHAEVRQTIHVPNVGTIAGSYVQDGKVLRSAMIRVVRDGIVIFEDKISSLKRFKDDVREVAQGYECGIGLDRFNDIKVGDVLEAYIMEEIER